MPADQPHLSIPEAAAALNVSESSVRRWVKDGRLKAIRMPSGRRKVRREEIEAILRDEPASAGAA